MNHGDEKRPYERPNGLIIGEPSPYQYVPPPLAPKEPVQNLYDATDTEPLRQITDPIEIDETKQDAHEDYFFYRHWREPFLRLVPSRYVVKTYLALYLMGGLMFGLSVYFIQSQGLASLLFVATLGVLVIVLPLYREIYRWRKRTVLIEHTKHGVRITYGEPDNIFLLFNGDGDGNVTTLEGSTEFNSKISWPNKLLFWGCGNLIIAGKVEGGAPPLLVNVPHIKNVRAFLNARSD